MIIFLDIDGVLKPLGYENHAYNYDLKPECVDVFNKYLGGNNIIISSDWSRYIGNKAKDFRRLRKIFKENKIEGPILDIFSDPILSYSHNRRQQIEAYVKKYKIDNYLILDDDISVPHPINSNEGLTKEWLTIFGII